MQKEEERARKKIELSKEKALEILVMRTENEKRVKDYVEATGKHVEHKRALQTKAKETDYVMRRTRAEQLESIHYKRRGEVSEMQNERKELSKVMIKDQEKDLRMKQKMCEVIRRKEEEARYKREQDRLESDRRIREAYERKVAAEEADARKAEKLVKALEKRERVWMIKLRDTQTVQETAFGQLEIALQGESSPDDSRGNTGERSEENLQPGEGFAYSSSSGNRVDMDWRESDEGGGRQDRPKSANSGQPNSTNNINLVKKVSSLPRMGNIQTKVGDTGRSDSQLRGVSAKPLSAGKPCTRVPLVERSRRRSSSKPRGAVKDFVH